MLHSNSDKSLSPPDSQADLDQMLHDIMPEVMENQSLPSSGCCKQQNCCKPQNCGRQNCCHMNCDCACVEILESIASVESSIACILNMEGEKLQKAICKANCITDLLEANCSVRDTIIHATHLEQILYSKLELALKLCKSNQKPKC